MKIIYGIFLLASISCVGIYLHRCLLIHLLMNFINVKQMEYVLLNVTNKFFNNQCIYKDILHISIINIDQKEEFIEKHLSFNLSNFKWSFIYGKCFSVLVDFIQSQTRHSFTNFVFNVLKLIINDHGLENVTKLSS